MHCQLYCLQKKRSALFFKKLPLLILCTFLCSCLNAQLPQIGHWREHLNHNAAKQVIYGNKIYCATYNSILMVNEQTEVEKLSKINGLSEVSIKKIGWDNATEQLIIAYENSNIDLVQGLSVININDLKKNNFILNKEINAIYCKNGIAYLCTAFGIILIDLQKKEIKDTWFIGTDGKQIEVYGITLTDNNYFAATAEGIKSAPAKGVLHADPKNWSLFSGSTGLTAGVYSSMFSYDNNVITVKKDSVFIYRQNNWQLLYNDKNWSLTGSAVSEGKILLGQINTAGESRVAILNTLGILEKEIRSPGIISLPRSATLVKTDVWVADEYGGLSRFADKPERFVPNSPPGTATGEMIADNNTIHVTAGSVNDGWNYQYNRNGIYQFSNETWTSIGNNTTRILDTLLDFITITADPIDHSIWAGSYGGGLMQLKQGTIKIFKQSNSHTTVNNRRSRQHSHQWSLLRSENNLWVSNFGAPQNLHARKTDGSWKAFTIPFSHNENAVSQIITDDYNQLWIISPKGNGIFCFSYGNSIDLLSDDRWKNLKQGIGYGNLPSNQVTALVKDKNGFIWIGTDQGIAVLQCPEFLFSAQACDAIRPIIKQDFSTGFLLKDEFIQCIAVDGANRKWIGTKNGIWLITPDGDKVLEHFTETNSPLLSNDVKKITIDPNTGEIFLATFKGICSFRSTVTEGAATSQNLLAFPNPVPANYSGTIAIRGLSENALVKITEVSGRLVYQNRAQGGQFVWNGKNYNGQKAASGIYLIIVRNDAGDDYIAGKLVVLSGN